MAHEFESGIPVAHRKRPKFRFSSVRGLAVFGEFGLKKELPNFFETSPKLLYLGRQGLSTVKRYMVIFINIPPYQVAGISNNTFYRLFRTNF